MSGPSGVDSENDESMEGGPRKDRTEHGATAGLGTEVGGTRNYRQTSGATGADWGTDLSSVRQGLGIRGWD